MIKILAAACGLGVFYGASYIPIKDFPVSPSSPHFSSPLLGRSFRGTNGDTRVGCVKLLVGTRAMTLLPGHSVYERIFKLHQRDDNRAMNPYGATLRAVYLK